MSECPECGAEVPGDGRFCPACGTDVLSAGGGGRGGRNERQDDSAAREALGGREPRVPSPESLAEGNSAEHSDQPLQKPWNQQEDTPLNRRAGDDYDNAPGDRYGQPPRDRPDQPHRDRNDKPHRDRPPGDRYDQSPRDRYGQPPGGPSEGFHGYPPALPHPADHKLLLAGVVGISVIGLLEGSIQAIAPELIIEAAVEEGFLEEGEIPESIIFATGVFGAIISAVTLGLTAYYYRERRLPKRYFWALVGAGAGGFLFAQSIFLALLAVFGIYGLVRLT